MGLINKILGKRSLSKEEVAIQGANNNAWAKDTTNDNSALTLERSLKIYDRTAKRAGFRKRKDKNWYRKIA